MPSDGHADFTYANLAVRGKILSQISDEQVEPVLTLRPDLITISAGGNDVIRPGADPDRARIIRTLRVLSTLNVPKSLQSHAPEPLEDASWRHARSDDVVWARTYLVPWLVRHRSSGYHLHANRPEARTLC